MKITPRRGHYLGVVVNLESEPDVATIKVDRNDKGSIVGAFGELLKHVQHSPLMVAETINNGDPMIIAQVVACDPHLEVLVAEAREKESSSDKYEAQAAKRSLDEFERNSVRLGERYAVRSVQKVGEDKGRPLVLFEGHDIIAHVDPE